MITYFIIGFVVVMLLGNFMSVKPKSSEMALDGIRMMARQIGLIPSLLATPDWLKDILSKKMVTIYTLVDDKWRLPMAYYMNDNGTWQRLSKPATSDRKSDIDFAKKADRLIGVIELPDALMPFVNGLSIKANSIAVVFDDELFAKSFLKQSTKSIQDNGELSTHLNALKEALLIWANKVNE